MHRRDGGSARIFFTSPARDHGGGGHAQSHRYAEDDGEHAFGERDGGDRIGAKTRYEEHVHDTEQRLHGHFEDHGYGQKKDGAADGAFGEILMRPDERVMEVAPDAAVGFRRGRRFSLPWGSGHRWFAPLRCSMQYAARRLVRPTQQTWPF